MHALRRALETHRGSWARTKTSFYKNNKRVAPLFTTLAILAILTQSVAAAHQPLTLAASSQSQSAQEPLVHGVDFTLSGNQFREQSRAYSDVDPAFMLARAGSVSGPFASLTMQQNQASDGSKDSKEQSLKDGLSIPKGARQAIFTSDPTKAPIDFSDVAPHWWADSPENTSVQVEIRTSKDGSNWADWQPADEEDIIMPEDAVTQTYASMISVDQVQRTHRFVQSRVTLSTTRADASPLFHELTYTFIDGGVTPNPPRPQLMIQGTPSDIPKPVMVSRKDWGSPQGEASPKWTPKYKRATHIIVHHTATSNSDTDWAARVRSIWYFHTYTRDWGDVGYNYLIDPNGVIYEGRAGGDDVEAGHAYPFNSGSVGIGMIGNFMKVPPSAAAQAALIDLISWKASQRGIDPLATEPLTGYTDCGGTMTYVRPTIAGHRDYSGKACGRAFNTSTCPGDRLWDMLPQIRAAVISEQPALRSVFIDHDTPGNLDPGANVEVHLEVRNGGSLEWPASGQGAVSVGYRWVTPDGQAVSGGWKGIKTPIPQNVPFADTVKITATMNAPTNPGHYAVLWDMYRDGQGWFSDQGSRPLRVDVVVGKGVGDKNAPKSSVLPLPVYSSNVAITVRWAGTDEARGSGLVSYDVQYRLAPGGTWTDWQSATAQTQGTFDGEDGYTYEFRSRARDAAGNVEAWPDKAQAYTTIDARPPLITIETPLNHAYVSPGPVIVRGRTEPGAFVAVNDTRAAESGGVYTSTVQAQGRDFVIHVTAADPAGNVSRLEVTIQAAPRYSDIPLGDPAFTAIEYLSDKQIISGYPDTTFRPATSVTRAQLAKLIVLARQWSLIKPLEGRFSDVDPTSWMFPYVETVAARGAMVGFKDGSFLPNAAAKRADVVRAAVLAAGWAVSAKTQRSGLLADGQPAHWSDPYVEVAMNHGILTPDEDGTFNPDRQATRAFTSVLVYKMINALQTIIPEPTPAEGGGE